MSVWINAGLFIHRAKLMLEINVGKCFFISKRYLCSIETLWVDYCTDLPVFNYFDAY